jgi:hypoxanthine phosphoribosyltransferase
MERIDEFISAGEISGLVKRVAGEINESEGDITFVTVFDGAVRFADAVTEELRCLGKDVCGYRVRVKSYEGTESSGTHKMEKELDGDVNGRRVIIVEDIVDSGRTIDFLTKYLINERGASGVGVASLFSKPSRREIDVDIDYLGMEIEDKFIIGFGLDYNGKYRELDYVGILSFENAD